MRLIERRSHYVELTLGQYRTVKGDSTGSIFRAATRCKGTIKGTTRKPKNPAQVRITPKSNSTKASMRGGMATPRRVRTAFF